MEEITLSTPGADDRSVDTDTQMDAVTGIHDLGSSNPAEVAPLVKSFLKATKARDRLAFTERGRARRHERHNHAIKALVKSMATEASRDIDNQAARLEIRTRIYATVTILTKAMSDDHLAVVERARRNLRVSLAFATLGFVGIGSAFVANGWIPLS